VALTVRYDREVDIMTIDTAPDIRIAVSSSAEDGLVVDYGSEGGYDVVGIEIHAAKESLAPFCALSETEAIRAQEKADSTPGVKFSYDKKADVLIIKSKYDIVSTSEVGGGLKAHFGNWDPTYEKSYTVVGIELHNASECLAPYFKLNRAPLSAAGGDCD
jgi:uncharacterized protein YuzE